MEIEYLVKIRFRTQREADDFFDNMEMAKVNYQTVESRTTIPELGAIIRDKRKKPLNSGGRT